MAARTMGTADYFATHDGVAENGGSGNQSTQQIIHLAMIVDVATQNVFITV